MKADREKEGWLGPVHTVVIEAADFLDDMDPPTLGPRARLLTVSYDQQGTRERQTTHCLVHGESMARDCAMSYDFEGNVNELLYSYDGKTQGKVILAYQGNKVVEESFCDVEGKLQYKREHKYDSQGNPVEMTYSKVGVEIVNKLKYDNEYDSFGNLTKITILKWITLSDKSYYKPITVNFQTITYY